MSPHADWVGGRVFDRRDVVGHNGGVEVGPCMGPACQ